MKTKGSLFKKERKEALKEQIKSFLSRWASLIIMEFVLYFLFMYMHWQVSGYDEITQKNHFTMILFDVNLIALFHSLIPYNKSKWVGIPVFLTIIYVLGNVLFGRYIGGYMPINAWLEYKNLNGLGSSIIYGLQWTDFVLIGLVVAVIYWNIKKHKNYPMYKERLVVMFSVTLFMCLLALRGTNFFLPQMTYEIWKRTEVTEGDFIFQRQLYTKYRGTTLTNIREIMSLNNKKIDLTSEERAEIEWFTNRKPFTHHFDKPRNILFVIVESLITDPIDSVCDNVEITPTLNRLKKGGLYCADMLSNKQKGQSSDGQFIYLTGLLPKINEITVLTCLENEYKGLGTAAINAGYETVIINPCSKAFWRQNSACAKYGINSHYSIEDYFKENPRDKRTGWLNDEEVFNITYQQIEKNKDKSLFLTVLTASTHDPYNKPFPMSLVEFPTLKNDEAKCYLQKTNYMDYHLGGMLKKMENDGILDDFIVVIAPDHSARCKFGHDTERPLPLIIWGKGVEPQVVKEQIRQIDIYPTMLNLMGYDQLPYMGLGRSVFDVDSIAPLTLEETQRISDLIIDGNFFGK